MQNSLKIPEGWRVKKLGECLEIKHGRPQHDVECENGKYPILASGGEIGRSNSFLCAGPSVLIGRKGTINKPQYMSTPFWTVDTLFYSLIKEEYFAKFLYYKFQMINWDAYNEGSTIPSLSSSTIMSIKVLMPPLPEQEKIAEILSCWDDGIEKLSALIEKKKIQKKALMQQLLTGKHRLKGFSTPWHEVKLGNIAEKITRKNLNQYTNVVTISAQNGFVLQQQFFSKSVAGEDLSLYNLLKCGEFGYNRSYSKGFSMGAIKRLDLFDAAPVSSLYICFSLNEYMDSNFMVNYFDAGLQNYELYKVAQEGARNHGLLNISLHDFFNIKLYIPSNITEQKAIAEILSKADEEIELLNKKLEAFKQEKKALMQQLLTGKIRVKVGEVK